MAKLSSYPTAATFKTTQKFLATDPSTSEAILVRGSDIFDAVKSSAVEGVYDVTEFTNIAGQSIIDLIYDVGLTQVLYNGVQLSQSDFTATNGTTVVLSSPVINNQDIVTVIIWGISQGSIPLNVAIAKAEAAALDAETAETAALASQDAAEVSEANSLASAGDSATSATASATSATASAGFATDSAGYATNSAASALESSSSALDSAADAVLTAADAVQTNLDRVAAASSATSSASSASDSSTSATNSATSASDSATSASAASTSEGNAASSASASAGSATASDNSATASASSATDSSNSALASQAALDEFQGIYYGALASPPTVNIAIGDLYFDTAQQLLKTYTSTGWKLMTSSVQNVYKVTEFTNVAGQTTFALAYDAGLVQILYNGVQLSTSDFTASSGSDFILSSPVVGSQDVITAIRWGSADGAFPFGTAASADVQVSSTDATAGRVLTTGAFGLGVDFQGNGSGVNVTGTVTADGLAVSGGSVEFSSNNQTAGSVLNITNSFSGSGWDVNDLIGTIDFRADDPSATQPIRGSIQSVVETGGGGNFPYYTALSFSTAAVNSLAERMRISADGVVTLSNTSTIDTTTGRVMTTGSFGLGSAAVSYNGGDWNDIVATSFSLGINRLNSPLPLDKWLYVVHIQAFDSGSGYSTQTAYSLDGELKQWQRHNTNGTWQPWIENYSTANAVGTVVSDKSGSIIEHYSSTSGSAVTYVTKYADGAMIIYRMDNYDTSIVMTPFSNGFYFNDRVENFPENFTAFPSVSNSSIAAGSVTLSVTGGQAVNQCYLRFASVQTQTTNHRLGYTAVGRWY